MCSQLINISRYIGSEKTIEYIIPELKELLDDEEGEVVTESIIQFHKITHKVVNKKYIRSDEAYQLFQKICEMTADQESATIDLALVLKKLGKLMLTFNYKDDINIVKRIYKIINNAKSAAFDEDIRAMLPLLFESLAVMYHENNMQILIDIY